LIRFPSNSGTARGLSARNASVAAEAFRREAISFRRYLDAMTAGRDMTGMNLAEVASLVGDPGRANMLASLMDGRALTAGELAFAAGVTPATASGHLAKLTRGRLLAAVAQGRHRYFRLASPEVARMLESIMLVGAEQPQPRRATPRVDPRLREARTCYDHLAGRLGVALADVLVTEGSILLGREAGEVTPSGLARFEALGVRLDGPKATRRLLCRPCLDWSERRPHLAGRLGAAMLQRFLALGWLVRPRDGRAVQITEDGRQGFAARVRGGNSRGVRR
jgi:DNA-binding transcriptional ArsR family regulator